MAEYSRRAVLGAVATGFTATLAGCGEDRTIPRREAPYDDAFDARYDVDAVDSGWDANVQVEITGDVWNESDTAYTDVTLQARIYDEEDVELGGTQDELGDLASGVGKPFEMAVSRRDDLLDRRVASYALWATGQPKE